MKTPHRPMPGNLTDYIPFGDEPRVGCAPAWRETLRRLVQESPKAHAYVHSLKLQLLGFGVVEGRTLQPWVARFREELQTTA